jgi:hypothetical protein
LKLSVWCGKIRLEDGYLARPREGGMSKSEAGEIQESQSLGLLWGVCNTIKRGRWRIMCKHFFWRLGWCLHVVYICMPCVEKAVVVAHHPARVFSGMSLVHGSDGRTWQRQLDMYNTKWQFNGKTTAKKATGGMRSNMSKGNEEG